MIEELAEFSGNAADAHTALAFLFDGPVGSGAAFAGGRVAGLVQAGAAAGQALMGDDQKWKGVIAGGLNTLAPDYIIPPNLKHPIGELIASRTFGAVADANGAGDSSCP